MAGGILILLGLGKGEEDVVGDYCGTGMHGGVMYIRGHVPAHKLGKEVKVMEPTDEDYITINKYVKRYAEYFGGNSNEILNKPFKKLIPFDKRPYGNLYTGW
jgi:glutamate synthase domain-containing protein 3